MLLSISGAAAAPVRPADVDRTDLLYKSQKWGTNRLLITSSWWTVGSRIVKMLMISVLLKVPKTNYLTVVSLHIGVCVCLAFWELRECVCVVCCFIALEWSRSKSAEMSPGSPSLGQRARCLCRLMWHQMNLPKHEWRCDAAVQCFVIVRFVIPTRCSERVNCRAPFCWSTTCIWSEWTWNISQADLNFVTFISNLVKAHHADLILLLLLFFLNRNKSMYEPADFH